MAVSFIKVYFDFEERTEQLTEEEQGRLLLAMLRYAKGEEPPTLEGAERFLFPVFKMDIDRDLDAYNAKVRNGGKGGRPKTEGNQTKPKETKPNLKKPKGTEGKAKKPNFEEQEQEQEQEQERDKERDGVDKPPRPRFEKPTIDDVRAYATERGYTSFQPERFIDYYTANGWKVGKNPMKDWRAAVRSWAARGDQGQTHNRDKPTNPALDYTQRDNTGYEDFAFYDPLGCKEV